jgi:DNA primase
MKLRYSTLVASLDIDALEEALDFEPVDRIGDEDRGHCILPWGLHKHGDTTGKFSINRDKKVFNCWVCGGGNLLSLVMAVEDLDESKALEWLAQFARSEGQTTEAFVFEINSILQPEDKTYEHVLPYYNARILDRWLAPDHPWFVDRGVSKETAKHYCLGFDQMHRKVELGKDPYHGEAIILPHFWQGRLVGWQERWLTDDRPKWVGKYTNTGDFPRRETLFNYDRCVERAAIPVVVESVTTALFLESNGVPAVATFGASVTTDQWKRLRVFQKGVAIAPDNDEAGVEYLAKAEKELEPYVPLYFIHPPDGEGADLGDLAKEPETVLKLVSENVP